MVSLEEGNLANPHAAFWKPNTYDVIFFRNAFMYFSFRSWSVDCEPYGQNPCCLAGFFLWAGPETLRGLSHKFQSMPHA